MLPLRIILWPALYIAFRTFGHRRSRVVVTCGTEVLLIKNRLPLISGKNIWSLPGGGIKRGELPAAAAARELFEELGITVDVQAIHLLGTQHSGGFGIRYMAWFFQVQLLEKPPLTLQKHEVCAAEWLEVSTVHQTPHALEVSQALSLLADQQ